MLRRFLIPLASFALASCTGQSAPTGVVSDGELQPASAVFTIEMLDRCEPESFNAVLIECVGDGKVTFTEFIAELLKKQVHHQWRFQPHQLALKAERPFQAVNVGGEDHTFTEVDEFGGGFVTDLNTLSGNPVPAPECLDFAALEFVGPGEATEIEEEEVGTVNYQCCIHPWMRTVLEVHR
ncbi:MAG TPA: hypothetical protein VG799_03455 [Gemmatimonadota bacterium]|nr:hypothetical protein [Gemmatimonadota bacterium]